MDITETLSVSVALAVHNGERHLREQLETIQRQTQLPEEIVVYDDASHDGSHAIVKQFASVSDIRVRLCSGGTSANGVTHSFAEAIRHCRGSLVLLCDQDDIWYPDKVAVLKSAFIQNPWANVAYSDADWINEAGIELGTTEFAFRGLTPQLREALANGQSCEILLTRSFFTGMTMAVRRDFALSALPVPYSVATLHDRWFALAAAATSTLVGVDIPLQAYRQHDKQWSRTRALAASEFLAPSSRAQNTWSKDLSFIERYRLCVELMWWSERTNNALTPSWDVVVKASVLELVERIGRQRPSIKGVTQTLYSLATGKAGFGAAPRRSAARDLKCIFDAVIGREHLNELPVWMRELASGSRETSCG